MASGSFKSNTGTSLNLIVEWKSTPYQSSNSSVVTVNLYIESYALYAQDLGNNYININGNIKYFDCSQSHGGGFTKRWIASHTYTVKHNSDGTKRCPIGAKWTFRGTYAGVYLEGISVSSSVTLDRINLSVGTPGTIYSEAYAYEVGSWGINWGAATNASQYRVQYRRRDLDESTWSDWITIGNTSNNYIWDTISSPLHAIQYRVEAINGSNISPWVYSEIYYHSGIHLRQAPKGFARIKVWTGSAWKHARVRVWDGKNWVHTK